MATSQGYFGRLWAALCGRELPTSPPPVVQQERPPDEQAARWEARVASLEMDLADRDRQIATMRSEYAALEAARQRAAEGASQEELERLFKRLVGPLSNLTALTAMADAGQDVLAADLVQLLRSLEKELARAGLEPIGKVGECTGFDVACHQRMSGGAVREGLPVMVQIPGYRFGAKVLMKAMVSAAEDHPRDPQAEEGGNG